MTITVKIKHDTPGSPWSIAVQGSYQDAQGNTTLDPHVELKPEQEISVTMWNGKQLLLTEIPKTADLESAP